MRLLFAKSKWESPHLDLGEFVSKVKAAHFDAVELYLPELDGKDRDVRSALDEAGLVMVAQIVTEGVNADEHEKSLRRLHARALDCGAVRVNCHTGADWLPFGDNVRLFEAALRLEAEHGVAICHETHRGRALYNAPDTLRFLRELPALKVTADLSHWQVVHETDDLSRQAAGVEAVVARAWHIHARVGCAQAPQVADPREPEFAGQFETLVRIWRRILETRGAEETDFVCITPEAGPAPYQQCEPATCRPLADPWEVNIWMRDRLRAAFAEFN